MFIRPILLAFMVLFLFVLASTIQAQTRLQLLSKSDSIGIPYALISSEPGRIHLTTNETGYCTINDIKIIPLVIKIKKIGFLSSTYTINSTQPNEIRLFLEADLNHLNEIVVYGNQSSLKSETANNIEVLESKTMREQGAMNLSDGIAKLPGVNQLSTGAGISKPVIRGLFGNRIQTVLMGMRFDNQQWQDEHGLGLSDVGIDRIEIIKGPASLFYGSEAMGGVLNIINEKPALEGKTQIDLSSRYFSNTNGYCFDAGIKKRSGKFFYGIRTGTETHADYSDGNNKRILNSRFGGNIIKGTFGIQTKKLVSENTYIFALNHFGFLMDAYQLFDKADARWSRSFERPHHTVMMNFLSSQNTVYLKASELKINAGVHINNRQEQEGASGISLDMLLNTYALSVTWSKAINAKFDLSLGSQNQFQTNRNNGSRIIVPDANMGEGSAFVHIKHKLKYIITEAGLRYDIKSIQTLYSGKLNNGDPSIPGGYNIVPVQRFYNTVNGCLGISLFDAKFWNLKLNFSSGYRGPNLAELSSNGLHEGSARYEIGNVNLKIEQNFCSDAFLEFHQKHITVFVDAYANRFLNYIYLQPSNADYLGLRIYNYIQKNAFISGIESGLRLHPKNLKAWLYTASYCNIAGFTDAREYLPFIPAQKLNQELKYKFIKTKKIQNAYLSINYVYVFEQNMVNQFETNSKAYQLINASIGGEYLIKQNKVFCSIALNNLSNETYYDHLSRFKYFGINNMGRNLNINLKYQFN